MQVGSAEARPVPGDLRPEGPAVPGAARPRVEVRLQAGGMRPAAMRRRCRLRLAVQQLIRHRLRNMPRLSPPLPLRNLPNHRRHRRRPADMVLDPVVTDRERTAPDQAGMDRPAARTAQVAGGTVRLRAATGRAGVVMARLPADMVLQRAIMARPPATMVPERAVTGPVPMALAMMAPRVMDRMKIREVSTR
jgi:hypothetical protein